MSPLDLSTIVRARIHPSIGIARIGDSPQEYLVGPQVTDPVVLDPSEYKDASGALKRQAAEFRVYGYNAAGEVVAELTAADVQIEWQAHLANSKAAWYEFQIALDIPDAARPGPDGPVPSALRNANITDRDSLTIDPGPRGISGPDAEPQPFDTGQFLGKQVYLGELRTDEAGRLLVLGGRGQSASATGAPPTTFANNEGWHDDTSDGPVTATVRSGSWEVPVEPAWVVVAPPNYAPLIKSVRTMYDLMVDAYVRDGNFEVPREVSFTRDILPILSRMCGLQWVNQGFAAGYGWGARQNFLEPGYLSELSSTAAEHAETRTLVWNSCRVWDRDGTSPVPWPWLYGDAMNLPPVSAQQYSTLSQTQYQLLERWAAGDFTADYDPAATPPGDIDEVPLAAQPAMLDRAALDFCLADAFHPGCELTWPMRHTSMYSAPFRIRRRAPGDYQPAIGSQLTPANVSQVGGPLYAQAPGDLTRWMAVPWQTDTASCRSGYTTGFGPQFDPYMPTFWPARVPNQVLTKQDYDIVMDAQASMADRQAAFARRAAWLRFLPGSYLEQVDAMVTDFGKLGVVATMPGPTDTAEFPPFIMVETDVTFEGPEPSPQRNLVTLHDPSGRLVEQGLPDGDVHVRGLRLASQDIGVGVIDLVSRFGHGRW